MPHRLKLDIPPAVLTALFPFHLSFDPVLRVLSVGPGMLRLLPALARGVALEHLFHIERPHVAPRFADIAANANMIFVLEDHQRRFRLRGQMVVSPDEQFIHFLCAPWITDFDAMGPLGLTLDDFPLYDAGPDVLQVLQAQKLIVKDLRLLNERLTAQRAELRASNQQLVKKQLEVSRLAILASQTSNPVIITDSQDCIEWVNDAFVRLTGYTAAEVQGRRPDTFLCGPETSRETIDFIIQSCAAGRPFSCEIANYTRDGRLYYATLEVHPLQDAAGNPDGFLTIQQDVTVRKLLERYSAAEIELTGILANASSEEETLHNLLEAICQTFQYDVGLIWLKDESGHELSCRAWWATPPLSHSRFLEESLSTRFAPGVGLPGMVWQSSSPCWTSRLTDLENFSRLPQAQEHGLQSAFAFPLIAGGNTLGVVEFYSQQTSEQDAVLFDIFSRISSHIAHYLDRVADENKRARLVSVLQATFESTTDGILVCDLTGAILSYNQRFVDLWGMSFSELDHSSLDNMLPFMRRNVVDPAPVLQLEASVRANPAYSTRETFHLNDGRVLEVYTQPQRLARDIIGRVWSTRDITEQWRSAEALRESEARFRVVAETAAYGILTFDAAQRITYANAAASRALGYPRGSIAGMDLRAIIPAGIEHSFCSIHSFEVEGRHADGRTLPLEASIGEYQIGGNQFHTLIFHDISDRKRAEEDLRQARDAAEASNRAKSAFVANMSHELRTPLNAILGYTEMLLEDTADNGHKEYSSDLNRILTAGRHLLSLINDILDMSKIEAGKMEIHPEWVNVESLVSECVSTVEPLASKNNNRLIVEPFDPHGPVWTDSTRFRQSLFNLLSNACKFTNNGLVELSLRLNEQEGREWMHWSVRDTGQGISKEDQAKLFEAFTQVNWSTAKSQGGTGLGLAITRQLCEAMGGHVSLESEPGKGSTFTLSLPRIKPEDQS